MPPPSFREVSPRAWDVYDLVCFLGIDELQTDEVRAGAPLIDRGKAHQKDTNGSYLYPEDHALRSACQFPFFLDRTPRLHQLWAVATYFALAFSGDSRFNKVAHYLIADATGLGKTTMMAMIVTYHVSHPSPRTAVRLASDTPRYGSSIVFGMIPHSWPPSWRQRRRTS